jgi:hypothetical protein
MLLPSIAITLILAADPPARAPAGAEAKFAPPVRLTAGDGMMGSTRLYPSPVLHDLDGDGSAEIVVGDLFGDLTVSHRVAGDDLTKWGPPVHLTNRTGERLNFNNW